MASHRQNASAAVLPPAGPLITPGTCAILCVALAGLTLLAYANSFTAGLTLDSKFIIGADPRLRAATAENLRLIFSENYWWPTTISDLYRPLTTLSYLFNYAVLGHGDSVIGYHVVNVVLHAANACLVFALLRRLSGRLRLAWLAAALFAAHPVNVEAVTNLVGRADLLATLAVLGSTFGACLALFALGARRVAWLGATAGIAMLGLLAKENAILALPLFVLIHACFLRGPIAAARPVSSPPARSAILAAYAAFLPSILVFLAIRLALGPALMSPGHSFIDNPIAGASGFERIMTAVAVLGRYVGLLVFPRHLSCDYSYQQSPLVGANASVAEHALAWGSLIGLAAAFVFAFRVRKSQPVLAWGVAMFLVALLPTANLLLPIGSIMAERFLYLPSIGFCAVGAAALDAIGACLAHRSSKPVSAFWLLPAAAVVALAARTHARNADWRDEQSIWQSAIVTAPRSVKAHLGLAGAIWEHGNDAQALEAALTHAERALALHDTPPLPPAHQDQALLVQLGTFYRLKADVLAGAHQPAAAQGFLTKSAALLQRAREVDEAQRSAFERAQAHRAGAARAVGNLRLHAELGLVHARLQQWPQLEAAGRDMQRVAPSDPRGYAYVAVARANSADPNSAAFHFVAALVLNPADADTMANLARMYQQLGLAQPPIATQSGGVLVDPNSPMARTHLNEAFALLIRNHARAGLARQATELAQVAVQRFAVPAALADEARRVQ